jgi:hypothetical protein
MDDLARAFATTNNLYQQEFGTELAKITNRFSKLGSFFRRNLSALSKRISK